MADGQIKIYGELISATQEGKLADANVIVDSSWSGSDKTQDKINAALNTAIANASGQATGLTLKYDSSNKKIQLLSGTTEQSSIDASAFIKDGMLKQVAGPYTPTANGLWTITVDGNSVTIGTVAAGKTYLGFVWDTDVNTSSASDYTTSLLDVSTLVDTYTAGNGISISTTNEISVDVSQDSGLIADNQGLRISLPTHNAANETNYLAIEKGGDDTYGLVTKGINDSINDSVNDAKDEIVGSSDDDSSKLTLNGLKAGIDSNASSITTLTARTNTIINAFADRVMTVTSGTSATVGSASNTYGIHNVRTFYGDEEIICQVSGRGTSVTVSWSGITPSSTTPIYIYYQLYIATTGAAPTLQAKNN